jgi:2-polyprenyl-3-methyl-5-hydroxy-6-metoxy-1,4-benzoquinol methylase
MLKCLYCGNEPKKYFQVFSKKFLRCPRCDLIFQKNIRDVDVILSSYREDYFRNYADDQIKGHRNHLFELTLDSIEKKMSTGRLLDIGTGCGIFLTLARKRGWKGEGLDPSKDSVNFAKKHHDLDVFWGTLKEYKDNKQFDVISFINVLDHTVAPWKEIELGCKLLKPGGLIYIRTPNGAFHSRLFKMFLANRLKRKFYNNLVFHEYCFSKSFIRKLLEDYGFSEIQISNSNPSGKYYNFFAIAFYLVAEMIRLCSSGNFLICPSFETTAIKMNAFENPL